MKTVLVILCLVIGVARPFIPSRPITWLGAYKDAAHLLVAFLLGGIVFMHDSFYSWWFGFLTAIEVICFFASVLWAKRTGSFSRPFSG